MTQSDVFDIFLATAPGLEDALCTELRGKGFKRPKTVAGGVMIQGSWPDVWRANLWLRGANRVLARLASFRAQHLAQLDDQARHVPWAKVLRPDVPFQVEATCHKSKIYHSGAAVERIAKAIQATIGAIPSEKADVTIMARLDHDVCTISIDTSGELLHRRGAKEAVNQAPMRETMAALFLQQCGYTGAEPVIDPLCGSGTFIIEAAEIAARLNPGRLRGFAFEQLATFDAEAWQKMRTVQRVAQPDLKFYGFDRDAGAIAMSIANAARAGIAELTEFKQQPISELMPPPTTPGLVIMNPPYGTRLSDKDKVEPLYRAIGQTLKSRFAGWRVGIITTDARLAHATGLPFLPPNPPVQHGGLRVTLYRTDPLLFNLMTT